jgi:porphobilinogen deaminase
VVAIRNGTRKSVMALAQTEEIARRLTAVAPDVDVEIVKFETTGDSDQTSKKRRATDELAATLRAKLDADLMGQSYSEIARHLNDAGIITVTDRKFYPLTVKNYVRRWAPE